MGTELALVMLIMSVAAVVMSAIAVGVARDAANHAAPDDDGEPEDCPLTLKDSERLASIQASYLDALQGICGFEEFNPIRLEALRAHAQLIWGLRDDDLDRLFPPPEKP